VRAEAETDADAEASSSASEVPLFAGALRAPLAALSSAVREGRLEAGRRVGVVCVCSDNADVAAQAAVRLRRVFGFDDVAALSNDA
jgi:hypothetical protein